MSELVAVRVKVHGCVQGVCFRHFTSRRAAELDLSGYVRNLPDGTVDVYAEGEREKLEELIRHLRAGPPAATVDRVEVAWGEHGGNYSGFGIRY